MRYHQVKFSHAATMPIWRVLAVRTLLALTLLIGLWIGPRPLLASASTPTAPKPTQKYASIIIDADSLEILHARNIDQKRFPASLTKMMTLYLVFDALESKSLTLDTMLPVSKRAAKAQPVKLGLKAGSRISVQQAIKALTVRSANDVAVVIAEKIGGSTEQFAALMTAKAQSLGMRSTHFTNPHGLPDAAQYSTARDMIKLASAHLRHHGAYYHYFSVQSFTHQGRTYRNHNTLLGKLSGVDGFKTGYTNASGYNLVISAKRDGRRIIAAVLGGASGVSRDNHMRDLVERGFEVITTQSKIQMAASQYSGNSTAPKSRRQKSRVNKLPVPQQIKTQASKHTVPPASASVSAASLDRSNALRGAQNWAVQLGAYSGAEQARLRAQIIQRDPSLSLKLATVQIIPTTKQGQPIFRSRLFGMAQEKARFVCNLLATRRQSCLVIAPH